MEVASPSCKRVASKSAGYDCVNNATVPQGRLRHQRARSAGYDCVNNATVPQGRLRNQRNVAQKPWGGPPSCDPAPLTTSLRGLWVSGNAGTGQWLLRTKGRRPKNRPSDTRGGDPKTDRATKRGGDPKTDLQKEELSKQLGCEGRGPENPGVVAPLTFYKLSRQLLVRRNVHCWQAYLVDCIADESLGYCPPFVSSSLC